MCINRDNARASTGLGMRSSRGIVTFVNRFWRDHGLLADGAFELKLGAVVVTRS